MNDELKKRLDELTADLGVDPEVVAKIETDLGAQKPEDLTNLTEADLTKIGFKTLQARSFLKKLTPAPEVAATNPMTSVAMLDVLPALPDDSSWLQSLKVGGILKFNRETVIGTISATLASRVGLYELPKKLVEGMETHSESLDEPVTAEFFEMQRMLTERSYADIFAAIPGATGRYATKERKEALLGKMNSTLWSSLTSFQSQLNGWIKSWQETSANPAVMMSMFTTIAGGGNMPVGMMLPPPTDTLRDSAEGVITSINRIFAGTGIIVAMALAYDAQQIRKALENPNLPAQLGAANREQMLKKLGVAVSSDFPRLEANLKRFALGIIELPNVTAGQTELAYITALYQLGVMIPWDLLTGDKLHRIGK